MKSALILFTNSAQFKTVNYERIFCVEKGDKVLNILDDISTYCNLLLHCKKIDLTLSDNKKITLGDAHLFYDKEKNLLCIVTL